MTALHDDLLNCCRRSKCTLPVLNSRENRLPMILDKHGHSGAKLQVAVVKTAPNLQAEVNLLQILGPIVCPLVLGYWTDGYAMEYIPHSYSDAFMLLEAKKLLEGEVWSRRREESCEWIQQFRERFLILPPSWVSDEEMCLSHGDPTLANIIQPVMGVVKLIDPKPPGNGIPSMRSVDLGKMVQSMMGWELALSGTLFPEQKSPLKSLTHLQQRRAIFWASIHFKRIVQREKESKIGKWATLCSKDLMELALS